MRIRRENFRMVGKLGVIVLGMFCFGYALVPIYKAICEMTGINVLALGGGPRWLAAYGVVVAVGISAAAVAIAATVILFRIIGPRRTRVVAQVVAVILGASFVIGLQVAAVISYGTLSRFAVLTSDATAAFAPDVDSVVWLPVRAILGDGDALLKLLGLS